MHFFKFFRFYHYMTGGRIYIYIMAAMVGIIFQGLAVFAFMPIFQLGNEKPNEYVLVVYAMLDQIGLTRDADRLPALLILAVTCFIVSSVGIISSKLYSAWLQTYLLKKIEMDINKKLFATNYEYYISQPMGYINNAIVQQVVEAACSFKHFATIIFNTALASLYFCLPLLMSPLKVLLLSITFLPLLIIFRYFNIKHARCSIQNVSNASALNIFLLEMLTNYKYFKSTNTQSIALKKLNKALDNLSNSMKGLAIYGGIAADVVTPFAIIIISSIVYLEFIFGNQSLTNICILLGLMYVAYQKAVVIPVSYQKFLGAIGPINVYRNLDSVLSLNAETVCNSGKEPDFSGPIKMTDLCFSYRSGAKNVLNSINIEIPPNKSVAFVGKSGSGKSTLVNIITGLLKPSSGSISLSNRKYDDLNLYKLRGGIGYVTQEPVIFNDTIINNISLWNHDVDLDRLKDTAKKAHADLFIENMSGQYNAKLGDGGINVSGGQRQRIAIARELYKDPPILIFDECTSSLDSASEQNIQESINAIHGKKSIIIIAHRLSTIKNCDKIFVLEHGKIIEEGSFSELYSKGGSFKEMVDRQSL